MCDTILIVKFDCKLLLLDIYVFLNNMIVCFDQLGRFREYGKIV
jgi:hypothetical protein